MNPDPRIHSRPRPKVSVLVIAYNVDKYIKKTLESILMQQVNFQYEIVIGEDCSTDRTRDILIAYACQHEDVINLILRNKNLGMNRNFFSAYAECRGKYIALLDGDDYWISPNKLQEQVEFLEAHPDYSTCFHNAEVIYEGEPSMAHPFHPAHPDRHLSSPLPRDTSTIEDLVLGNFMQTGSVVFRADDDREVPAWFYDMPTFDWPLHIANAQRGKIKYIDEVWSVYRVHEGGMWSSGMSLLDRVGDVDAFIRAANLVDRHTGYWYSRAIRKHSAWMYEHAMDLLYNKGEVARGNRYALEYLKRSGLPRSHASLRSISRILRNNLKLLAARYTTSSLC